MGVVFFKDVEEKKETMLINNPVFMSDKQQRRRFIFGHNMFSPKCKLCSNPVADEDFYWHWRLHTRWERFKFWLRRRR